MLPIQMMLRELKMYEEHVLLESLPDDAKIWKYMDFAKFVSLMDKEALFFANSSLYDDPVEGLYTIANKKKFDDIIKGINKDDKHLNEVKNLLSDLLDYPSKVKSQLYFTCWHRNEHESAAMWKLYTDNDKGISIQSNFKRLKDCFSVTGDIPIHIGKVKYVDYDEFEIPVHGMENSFYPYYYKRKSFEHESEIRAMTTTYYKTDNNEWYKNPLCDDYGAYVPISLDTLIDKVYVSPKAPKWFVDLVVSVSTKYELKKEVIQSNLYNGTIY